jgi:hypothetical protein
MEIRFTNNKQKAKTKKRIETRQDIVKISCKGDVVVNDDDDDEGIGKIIVLEKKEK